MIPVKEKIEEISNLPGKEVYATIGDPRMVMKSLTKLYSNTMLATIREYSTNARDSNVEAGRADVPIEVTLPTVLNPYFIVKDTGSGLSEEELEKVYISYGTSTKRNSNLFNGYLGYGSKSALSYTNTFTVTSIKDGIRTIAVITRKPDYTVALKVVTTSKTTERNGVTIKVPVQEYESFRRIAMDFYRFWQPGTILVDGVEPPMSVGAKIDDGLYYSKTNGTSYVVMGNVGYRVANPDALFANKKIKAISFVAFVENGSVEFTPSREDLEYSDATKATLHGIIENFEKKMLSEARKQIEKAKDSFESYSAWVEWGNLLGYSMFSDLTFKGDKFKKNIEYSKQGYSYNLNTYRRYNTDPLRPLYDEITVSFVNKQALVVTGMSSADISSTHKAKAKDYIAHMNLTGLTHVYFLWEDIENQWVTPERMISWKDMLAALPKKVKPKADKTGRIPGSFDYVNENGTWHHGQPVPDEGTVFWISIQAAKQINLYNVLTYHKNEKTKEFKGKVSIIHLGANRIDKFKRENPKVKNFKEWAVDKVELDGEKFLSPEAKIVMGLSESGSSWVKILDKIQGDILDPDWKNMKESLAKKNELMLDYNKAYNYAVACGLRWQWKAYRPVKADLPFSHRYPLLLQFGYNFPYSLKEDIILYMNEAYKRRVKTSV